MALADAIAGSLRPGQTITWTRADGTPENLTGATITGILQARATGETRAIAGILTVTDGANGEFTWAYHADDLVAGVYLVQFTAAFASGATPAKTFLEAWAVRSALSLPVP